MANKISLGASLTLDGEKEYKQALKEITSEQKLLTSEMKLSAEQFKNNANSVEALQSKNEILTKQISSQTDRVELYTKAVEESTAKQKKAAENVENYKSELEKAKTELDNMKSSSNTTTDALEKQEKVVSDLEKKLSVAENAYNKTTQTTNSYKTSLNNAEAGLQKLDNELVQNEKYLEEAKTSANKTATSIDNMGNKAAVAKTEVSSFGSTMQANLTSAAIIGGVIALGNAVKRVSENIVELGVDAAKYADDMLTLSTQTGISTDKLQAYNYMAELTDTSMETIEKTMVKNIKSMYNAQKGTEDYVDAYNELGVAFEDSNKNLLDSETVYWNLIDALGQIEDETKRDSLSLVIFGKSAQDLNTLVAQGSAGIKEFTDEAISMGAVLDKDTLQKLVKTSDAIDRFTQSTEILKRKIGAELSDEIEDSMDRITEAITDSSDEIADLAEDGINLLTDGFEWLIDNADIVIAGLSGIGASMITAKAVSGVTAAIDAYKTLSAATKTAAVSQEALNLAQAANPIGLLITAVAGITAAMITYSKVSEGAETETQKFLEATKESTATLNSSIESRNQNIQSIQSEYGFMKTLETELSSLNEKEVLSNAEKSRMNEIVAKLNSELPELNLAIDEQTGKLIGNTAAIKDSIEQNLEWYKVQAAKEELTELYEDQADAELEIYKINQQLEEQQQKLIDIEESRAEAIEKANEAIENGIDDGGQLQLTIEQLTQSQDEATSSIEKLTEQKNALSETEKSQAEQVDILNGYIGENTEATEENTDAVEEASNTYTAYGDIVVGASADMTSSINELNESFSDAKESAEDSLNSQIGLFQAASEQSSISVSEMADNLASQTEAFNQYKDDLLAASGLVEDGLMQDGLLGYIESFGIDGAGYLHELVNAAETDKDSFNDLMAQWAELSDAKSQLSDSMAEIETNYTDAMARIGVVMDDGNEEVRQSTVDLADGIVETGENLEEEFVNTYDRMMVSANDTIVAKTPEVASSATSMGANVITALNTELEVVDGKSLKAQTAATAVVDGFAAGIYNGTSTVSSAFQAMINDAIDNADFSGLTSKLDRAIGSALR